MKTDGRARPAPRVFILWTGKQSLNASYRPNLQCEHVILTSFHLNRNFVLERQLNRATSLNNGTPGSDWKCISVQNLQEHM